MLTKKDFVTTYNQKRKKLELPAITEDSLSEFYESCISSKDYFINMFGKTMSCTYEVETDKEIDNSDEMIPLVSGHKVNPFPKRVSELTLDLLKEECKLTLDDCKQPTLPNGRKVLKIINKAVEKLRRSANNEFWSPDFSNRYHSLSGFAICLKQYFETQIKTIRFQRETYDITISSDPFDFLGLGHNHCDKGKSCFANNTRYGYARYRLATAKNTFVALLKDPESEKVLARCWGFYNERWKTWHFTNFYVNEISKEGFLYLLKIVIDEITGKDNDQIKKMRVSSGREVYNNRDGYMFSYKKSPDKRKSSRISYPKRFSLQRIGYRSRIRIG